MLDLLCILTVLLVAVAMALALAHALELPGKRRLSRDEYLVVQPIYYPGFTFGGIAGPLARHARHAGDPRHRQPPGPRRRPRLTGPVSLAR